MKTILVALKQTMSRHTSNCLYFAVGDRVEWDEAYPHLRWLEPFEVYKMRDEWAMLKWVSFPVRLDKLKKVG